MAARDWVVRWFGESVARRIEQFVEGGIFGDEFVTCRQCSTPVAAAFISERKKCPVCGARASQEMMIESLEARKAAAMAAGGDANEEVEEIDRRLAVIRNDG